MATVEKETLTKGGNERQKRIAGKKKKDWGSGFFW